MRQAVLVGPEAFAVREAPRAAPRDPGEILLRTIACGLCSGDLMPWYLARMVGTVLGHEPIDRAVGVGAGVTSIRSGDSTWANSTSARSRSRRHSLPLQSITIVVCNPSSRNRSPAFALRSVRKRFASGAAAGSLPRNLGAASVP